ncbi:hypothetical protein [Comamonas antarctica]|uniref:Uncharacterized protein n=1 Tax=Comamonas antarctica TaxID=2743470 RepID=A0A6N1WZZ6_9BURK|nr:hypothetical protein [Comamonas antarctica]QKV51396.1 hypothetical protein HUK68_16505 [Comamonas antarctica]
MQIQGSSSVAGMSVQGMDIETTLLAVQSQRASLLENQLRGQLETVTAKNDAISQANEQLTAKRIELAALEASNAGGEASPSDLKLLMQQLESVSNFSGGDDKWIGLGQGWGQDGGAASNELLTRIKDLGLSNLVEPKDIDANGTMDATGATIKDWMTQIKAIQDRSANIATLKVDMENLKTGIDSLSNAQQMDMLRLQSLSNKRNEAFDVMTNFMKKMQDNRSGIIGNMR